MGTFAFAQAPELCRGRIPIVFLGGTPPSPLEKRIAALSGLICSAIRPVRQHDGAENAA